MTVYVVAQLKFKDRARYKLYQERFTDVLDQFSGRLLCADERPELLEGEWPYDKVVLIAFADKDSFKEWSNSQQYREILEDRKVGAAAVVILARGVT